MENAARLLLRVLVGSRAHGLSDDTSDYDFRTVYAVPTSLLLSVGETPSGGRPDLTVWQEKKVGEDQDVTGWEIGHYLSLALRCNPTILEVLAAPPMLLPSVDSADDVRRMQRYGAGLQRLFSAIWTPHRVHDAFVGYGVNQRKKFLDGKDKRRAKYAVAYLRVLFQADTLLRTGVLPISMIGTPVEGILRRWRTGVFTLGEVVDQTDAWTDRVDRALAASPVRVPNLTVVNEFLLSVRMKFWAGNPATISEP